MAVRDLLLEIGTEEIPAVYILPAVQQLKEIVEAQLLDQRIEFNEIEVFATPRRLSLWGKDVSEKQSDQVLEFKGPAKNIAFDEQGQPTKALKGFARSKGVALDQILLQDFAGKEFVIAKKLQQGQPTLEILKKLLPAAVKKLYFPKTMRWGNGEYRFVRPVHWLIALFDSEIIPFELFGIKTDNKSKGHRFWGDNSIEVNLPADYLSQLEDNLVIVNHQQRTTMILEAAQKIAQQHEAELVYDQQHLEEVTFLVEYPAAVVGNFDQTYLQLPPEVLIISMKKHQRYFPLRKNNQLLPLFITFKSGPLIDDHKIKAGNEKVLKGRLEDALFFYQEDSKTPLVKHAEKLQDIIFIQELGSMTAKTKRVSDLSLIIASLCSINNEAQEILQQGALLAKADLATLMVGEFPDLQGIMGRVYAQKEGLGAEISSIIEEHYYPRFAEDRLPQGELALILALADRIDNIASAFYCGKRPSGSQDPLALRRQGLAVLRILEAIKADLSLLQNVDTLITIYQKYDFDLLPFKGEIEEFLMGRLERFLTDKGFSYDIVDALVSGGEKRVKKVLKIGEALTSLKGNQTFLDLTQSYVRADNILTKNKLAAFNLQETVLIEQGEKDLFYQAKKIKAKALILEEKENYQELLELLSTLAAPLEYFFDTVMVMVEAEELRLNRLSLLAYVKDILDCGADLSKIVIE